MLRRTKPLKELKMLNNKIVKVRFILFRAKVMGIYREGC